PLTAPISAPDPDTTLFRSKTRIPLAMAGLVYALFAAGCFRLAVEHGYERGVSIGEGSFVLLGAAAFFVAASRSKWQAAAVAVGTDRKSTRLQSSHRTIAYA